MNRRSFLALPFVAWFAAKFKQKGRIWAGDAVSIPAATPIYFKHKPGVVINIPLGWVCIYDNCGITCVRAESEEEARNILKDLYAKQYPYLAELKNRNQLEGE